MSQEKHINVFSGIYDNVTDSEKIRHKIDSKDTEILNDLDYLQPVQLRREGVIKLKSIKNPKHIDPISLERTVNIKNFRYKLESLQLAKSESDFLEVLLKKFEKTQPKDPPKFEPYTERRLRKRAYLGFSPFSPDKPRHLQNYRLFDTIRTNSTIKTRSGGTFSLSNYISTSSHSIFNKNKLSEKLSSILNKANRTKIKEFNVEKKLRKYHLSPEDKSTKSPKRPRNINDMLATYTSSSNVFVTSKSTDKQRVTKEIFKIGERKIYEYKKRNVFRNPKHLKEINLKIIEG